MKVTLTAFFLFIVGFSIMSCSNPDEELQPFECDDDALFSRENVTGSMFYLSCYDVWSIKLDELNAEGNHLYGASTEMPEEFKEEGLAVEFSACFYEFDLPLIFPDPSFFGETYVIRDFRIEKAD